MPITVERSDTFEQWRVKTNNISSDLETMIASNVTSINSNIGNLSNLVTVTKSNIVAAINETQSSANITGGNATINRLVTISANVNSNLIVLGNASIGNTPHPNSQFYSYSSSRAAGLFENAATAFPTLLTYNTAASPGGWGLYANSFASYGIYGITANATATGGVIGVAANGSTYGSLGYANKYALYGVGDGYFSGNVGIGIIPTAKFQVSTTNHYAGYFETSSVSYQAVYARNSNSGSGNYAIYALSDKNAAIVGETASSSAYALYAISAGSSSTNPGIYSAGTIYAAGDITSASDIALKEDVSTITNALDIVSSLRGVRYKLKDSKQQKVGLIANEVQQVVPEVVNTQSEHLGISYGNLVGVLVEAIKELKAEIEELKAK